MSKKRHPKKPEKTTVVQRVEPEDLPDKVRKALDEYKRETDENPDEEQSTNDELHQCAK